MRGELSAIKDPIFHFVISGFSAFICVLHRMIMVSELQRKHINKINSNLIYKQNRKKKQNAITSITLYHNIYIFFPIDKSKMECFIFRILYNYN
jgi:hypothetical protein